MCIICNIHRKRRKRIRAFCLFLLQKTDSKALCTHAWHMEATHPGHRWVLSPLLSSLQRTHPAPRTLQ